ncbi:hypothetical protein ABZO31_21965 [Streptomyces sp. HUAS MG47]|uniref:hypothetical protein n=1 Tax=Streptomyces solicamelliae TaxID=3231716 RepID=UPI003877961C
MAAADHRSAVHANSDAPAEQLASRRLTARHGDRPDNIMEVGIEPFDEYVAT